jgi:hypothetical protein
VVVRVSIGVKLRDHDEQEGPASSSIADKRSDRRSTMALSARDDIEVSHHSRGMVLENIPLS